MQGPVGYIPAPTLGHNWPPDDTTAAAATAAGYTRGHQQPSELFCHGQTQRVRDTNHHRDHLVYLRNRRQPAPAAAFTRAPLPGYMFPGGGPTYADQAGRVWPVPKSGTLGGGPQPGWPAPPHPAAPRTSKNPVGPRPVYRTRSDETLSTVSSKASRHRRKHCIATDRASRRMAERNRGMERNRGPTTAEPCAPTSVPVTSLEPVPLEEPAASAGPDERGTTEVVVEPAPVKSAPPVDSSSNPDSGYSGASGSAAVVKLLSRCSETSSPIHSAASSSADLASNPAVTSSVRSDSVTSLCNSL